MKFIVYFIVYLITNLIICKESNRLKKQDKEASTSDKSTSKRVLNLGQKTTEAKSKNNFFLFDGETYSQELVHLGAYIGNCYIRYNSTIFDLTPLSKYGPFYMNTKSGNKVEFDVCRNVISQCNHKIKGLVVSNTGNTCRQFSNKWSYDKNWTWTNMDKINLEFPEGEICNSFTSEKYKVKMVLECANSTSPKLVNDGTFENCLQVLPVFDTTNPFIL